MQKVQKGWQKSKSKSVGNNKNQKPEGQTNQKKAILGVKNKGVSQESQNIQAYWGLGSG